MSDHPVRPFVFLDRDGTLIEERHYLSDPAQVTLCPGAATGLRHLQQAGYRLVVISNQSGIARGYFTDAQLHAVNARMAELLRENNVTLDGIYWCPHSPHEGCNCRKPRPGMVHQTLCDLGGTLTGAVVVGDKECDIQLARNLGIPPMLVRTGYGRATEATFSIAPEFVADDLSAVATHLLRSASE